jgi:hypothetical protein
MRTVEQESADQRGVRKLRLICGHVKEDPAFFGDPSAVSEQEE